MNILGMGSPIQTILMTFELPTDKYVLRSVNQPILNPFKMHSTAILFNVRGEIICSILNENILLKSSHGLSCPFYTYLSYYRTDKHPQIRWNLSV